MESLKYIKGVECNVYYNSSVLKESLHRPNHPNKIYLDTKNLTQNRKGYVFVFDLRDLNKNYISCLILLKILDSVKPFSWYFAMFLVFLNNLFRDKSILNLKKIHVSVFMTTKMILVSVFCNFSILNFEQNSQIFSKISAKRLPFFFYLISFLVFGDCFLCPLPFLF